jgi:hypothetical protein
MRQIEMYESGDVLTYDRMHLDDEYGGFGDVAREAEDEWRPFEIRDATAFRQRGE